MKQFSIIVLVLAALAFTFISVKPRTGPVLQLAVASSFAPFLKSVAGDAERRCHVNIQISSGASGVLATQILNGGPFDVFFSADRVRPQALIKKGKGVATFSYAIGQLVYWQPSLKNPDSGDTRPLAVADPALAPYGQASLQSLPRLRRTYDLPDESVWGRSTAQVFQFVTTGAAKAGLLPLSLVRMAGVSESEYIVVPASWYLPIRQDGVVVHPSRAADCLLNFLQTPASKAAMADVGFRAPS